MFIGICIIELHLPAVTSLKEKRGILKAILARLHREFNVSAAEVALHDVWQSASIGIATVSTSAAHASNLLENAIDWLEHNRPDLDMVAHSIEIVPFGTPSA
ncbi:MAG: DUF503 domain-containing protein [Candidatus Thermofonsia Clade 1 bacterium]|jgi:uncharacterized protein YlxP (DUF503 family)|uniref:DUF503 domain-containing protein n=1 Tax=Candidatus Thermofonsia Clade 1 bacterium TaxID=2364210 RepID=A0A2M8PXY8_9CHLR|nr:MAG: DUF503 domain-containing protein [Candidatus Thermofonsia Clade 1 bacterium]PJF42425.1 MAG: DUF503 domain-containing protein [Candidatus Thermofonsia Clade 1 bacterium]RMF51069.1 MAG: DUF503 domain-containing protein [Chloroflexota bacterium]